MVLKVAWTSLGSSVRGVVAEEESSSNASLIEAEGIRILIENFGADIYITHPIQLKTREILEGKYPTMWKDYLKHIHVCSKAEDEPSFVDLIWCSSGSENLRLSGRYLEHEMPCAAFMYRTFNKYKDAPIIYFQTDYAAENWYTGESYGSIFQKLFDCNKLYSQRRHWVLASGHSGEDVLKSYMWLYGLDHACRIRFLPPDSHFLIDLAGLNTCYDDMPEKLESVAFCGKQRHTGSREDTIEKYLTQSTVPFTLAGRWKEDKVAKFQSLNEKFTHLGRLPSYKDVTDLYNKVGATIYMSNPEYHKCCTVTSRFYDAIHSKAVPFIHADDYETVEKVFGPCRELVVTPETLQSKLDEFSSIESRRHINNELYIYYAKNRDKVVSAFKSLVQEVLDDEPEQTNLYPYMESLVRNRLTNLRRNKPKTDEELESRVSGHFSYIGNTIEEIFIGNPKGVAMQLGLKPDTIDFQQVQDKVDFLTR